MPTAPSRGPRGYPDFQRVENWDGTEIIPAKSFPVKEAEVIGTELIDVSRFTAVALTAECSEGEVLVQAEWWATVAEEGLLGLKQWRMGAACGRFGYFRISNLGPFFRLRIKGIAAKSNFIWESITTNRQPIQEAVPKQEVLATFADVLGINGEATHKVLEMASGTLHLVVSATVGEPCRAESLIHNAAGQLITNGGVSLVAGLGTAPTVGEMRLPVAPLEVAVVNGAKAQTVVTTVLVAP